MGEGKRNGLQNKKYHGLTPPTWSPVKSEMCGEPIQPVTKTGSLRFLITYNGALAEGTTERAKKERFKVYLLRTLDLHACSVIAKKLLNICEVNVCSTATYEAHPILTDRELNTAW